MYGLISLKARLLEENSPLKARWFEESVEDFDSSVSLQAKLLVSYSGNCSREKTASISGEIVLFFYLNVETTNLRLKPMSVISISSL